MPRDHEIRLVARYFSAQGRVVGLTFDGDLDVLTGYDSGLYTNDASGKITDPTQEEKIALAKHMIERWKFFLAELEAGRNA